ncbi:hypothetical protein ACFLQV_01435 [Calditrichota bacterium]
MENWIYRELSGTMLPAQKQVETEDLDIINNLDPQPPLPLIASDLYVRRVRLAGDAIDAGFGRFRTEDLPRLLEMVQGAPALVGHRKDTLGVARFFGGELQTDQITGITYIVPKFYWMRMHSEAEDLRVNIDGGIYSEASIGFTFKTPTCSICDDDVRHCEHMPGTEYDDHVCCFYYDDILRVTEGSLVYRGAQPGTRFELGTKSPEEWANLPRFKWQGVIYRGIPEGN